MDSRNTNPVLIRLMDATLRVRDRLLLPHTTWEIRTGENWIVEGPNGSGKTTLLRALTGEVPVVRGKIERFFSRPVQESIGYVSFEQWQKLIKTEAFRAKARSFSGNLHNFTSAKSLISEDGQNDGSFSPSLSRTITGLGIDHLMEKNIQTLSTGEFKKVLLARALITNPDLLILDEPFEGLDHESRQDLLQRIQSFANPPCQLIIATHRIQEINEPSRFSHVMHLKNDRVREKPGPPFFSFDTSFSKKESAVSRRQPEKPIPTNTLSGPREKRVLIRMNSVTVQYRNQKVLDGLNWTVKAGEHWGIVGPNGAGKTTLLKLISGDHLQAYANDITVFGWKRGSGESVWEIKKQIGLVSPDLQFRYTKAFSAEDVVVSGFFDSVGLYRKSDDKMRKQANQTLHSLCIGHLAQNRIDRLSFGEKRMVLIARALVKNPALLILDEPCQGLDSKNREKVLDLIDKIGTQEGAPSSILYVTHFPEELPACLNRLLRFEKKINDGFKTVTCCGIHIGL